MAFTFFFRDSHVIEHVVKHFVPYVSGRINVRVWDAGCAMGQEPYTLAIIIAENMGHFAFKNLRIYASDIDKNFEKIVSDGIYAKSDLERIPQDIFKKYFEETENGSYKIDEKIRSKVTFKNHDLLTLEPIGNEFSLIMCKNVLLHFQPQERIEVIKMFHRVLSPGGFFATEQTQKLPQELSHLFEQVVSDAQLYRKI